MNDNNESEKEYIVYSGNSWGRDTDELSAVQNMVPHMNFPNDEKVKITVVEVRGFQSFTFMNIPADEIISEETLEVDGKKLRKVKNMLTNAELLTEEILVEAQE